MMGLFVMDQCRSSRDAAFHESGMATSACHQSSEPFLQLSGAGHVQLSQRPGAFGSALERFLQVLYGSPYLALASPALFITIQMSGGWKTRALSERYTHAALCMMRWTLAKASPVTGIALVLHKSA